MPQHTVSEHAIAALEQEPGFLAHDTARLFRLCFSARLADMDLSEAQWRVLGTVNRFAGITQTQLADVLGIGKAPLGNLIDRLQARGLVCRRGDDGDRRIRRIYASADAEPVTRLMRSRYQQLETEFLRGVTAAELAAVEGSLRRICRNLTDVELGDLSLMHTVALISRLNRRRFDQRLKALGFTRCQWLVLATISGNEGLHQSALAEHLHMQKAPLGVLVEDLVQDGWVERRRDPADGRARQLFMSATCGARWATATESFHAIHALALTGINAADRKKLGHTLRHIRGNLQGIAGEQPQ